MFALSKKITLFFCAAVLSFMAQSAIADQLAGSEWSPSEVAGASFDISDDIFVRFEQDGRFVGNGGCNGLSGRYVTNGNSILFGPTAATMMACDDATSNRETAFVSGIAAAREFARDGVALELMDSSGEIVMRLSQRDAD